MKKIVVGNWKMNLAASAAAKFASEIVLTASTANNVEAWIAPPFTSLASVASVVKTSPVRLGAQNVHWDKNGAFTGEVSVEMLRELGCSFAIIGHSERRHVFGESNELVAKRAVGALSQDFKVIFCVGETLSQREASQTSKVLKEQLDAFFALANSLPANYQLNLVVAYEPVWAIGTGKVASLAEIEQAHHSIQECLAKNGAGACPILYGGSVTPENFGAIVASPLVSGGLVGGASLVASKFMALVELAK